MIVAAPARMKPTPARALLFLALSTVLALSFALPRGPEGLDLPTLCKTNRRMLASPACRQFLNDGDGARYSLGSFRPEIVGLIFEFLLLAVKSHTYTRSGP